MNFKELAAMRYSVRSYTAEPVSAEALDYIIECARLAPSAVNFQPWRFHVVTSEDVRTRLHACYSREWFQTAPLYIVCTVRHDEAWVRKSDGKDHGNIDIAIAAEHICLAAADQGLGSCWVCNFDAPLCAEILALPAEEEAAVIIPIGHIAPDAVQPAKQRKPLTDIVVKL